MPSPVCTGRRKTSNVSGTPRAIRFMTKVRATSVMRNARCASACWSTATCVLSRELKSDAAEPGHRLAEGKPVPELGRRRFVVEGVAGGQARHLGRMFGRNADHTRAVRYNHVARTHPDAAAARRLVDGRDGQP